MRLISKLIMVYIIIWIAEYIICCWVMLDWLPWASMFGSGFEAIFGRLIFLSGFISNYAITCFLMNIDPIELKKM